MSSSTAFNEEKGGSSSVGEPEYGHDPASGGIFSSDYKRYEAYYSGMLRVVLFALLGIVGRHDGGRRCAFPSSLWFTRVLMCWMGCNGKTQTLFAVRPVIETISNL